MSIYSTLGKYFVASALITGGVTGTVLGTTASEGNNEVQVMNQVDYRDRQDTDLTNGLSGEKSVKLPAVEAREETKLVQSNEQWVGDLSQKSEPQSSEVVSSSPVVDKGPDNSAQEAGDPVPELEEESDLAELDRDPNVQLPKLPLEPAVEAEDPVVKADEDWTKRNWFLTKWNDGEDLDESSWLFSECEQDLKDEEALLTCPWNDNREQIIELRLVTASDEELIGKKWSDIGEMHFKSSSEDFATLELTYLSKSRKEILLFLYRKTS